MDIEHRTEGEDSADRTSLIWSTEKDGDGGVRLSARPAGSPGRKTYAVLTIGDSGKLYRHSGVGWMGLPVDYLGRIMLG